MNSLYQKTRHPHKKQIRKTKRKGKRGSRGSVSLLRIQMEMDRLELPSNHSIELIIPSKDNLLNFQFEVTPQNGLWKGATYSFTFDIPDNYPMVAPNVKCNTKIYHPNIDYSGNVCLTILKTDWSPLCTIEQILHHIMQMFFNPDGINANNQHAGKQFRDNIHQFEATVAKTLEGGFVRGIYFPQMIHTPAGLSSFNRL